MADPAPQPIDRRTFVKTAAVAAAAAGGIEGILAARRAPAFAQGTKLHWVRWVDFVPESDVELKRQMPEASKALGAEVTLETINANDLQARITAAIQSGSGADIFLMQYNWPQLYANALVDVSDVANDLAKAEGGFYEIYPPSCNVNGKWLSVPHSVLGNAVASGSRGSRRQAPVSTRRPGTTRASSSPGSRRRANLTGRPSGTPSATRRCSPIR
jgi:multiple sugar transport system substrate-binding protein